MKTKKSLITIFAVLLALSFSGCATLGIPGPATTFKKLKSMDHKDRAILAIATYNDLWEDYQDDKDTYALVYPEGLPDEAQEDLDDRKKFLTRIYPIIVRYDKFASEGGVLKPGDIEEIMSLLKIYYLKKQGG